MQSGTSFTPVPAYCMQLTNQCACEQGVGICADIGMLYGRRAEVSLMDYFLARRVINEQSDS